MLLASEFSAVCLLLGYISTSVHHIDQGTEGEWRSLTRTSQAVAVLYLCLLLCCAKQGAGGFLTHILGVEDTGLLKHVFAFFFMGKTFKGKILVRFGNKPVPKNH